MDKLEEFHYFTSPIYTISKPEFLPSVRAVTKEYLAKSAEHTCKKQRNPATLMTSDFSGEPSIAEFTQYVSQTAWNILDAQGYAMENLVTYFMEMWTQEHKGGSGIDQHVHGHGAAISVFYFLDVPEDANRLIIYDPRPAKVITNLPQKNMDNLTPASIMINFEPKEGTLFFTPSWLPHSFTRNGNKNKPMRFVHMNLNVSPAPQKQEPKPEVEIV